MNILFFDIDHALELFLEKHPIKQKYTLIKTDINSTSDVNLKKLYQKTDVISLFAHSEMVSNERLDKFPNLKMIATRSTGFNHIDLDYCKKRGIIVCNVPRYGESTVAEFAFGLLLTLVRRIIPARTDMMEGHIHMHEYVGFDLMGKTLGVIGTGSIGAHVIKIAQGFGMNVIAYDLFPKKELKGLYVKTLNDLYKKADVISLHVPSTPENVHMMNKESFAKMKKGVVIINTARGDLIDNAALFQALKSKHIAAAGLDVMENEDFLLHDEVAIASSSKSPEFLLSSAINFKLLQLKNVIATPHIAFNSTDAVERILQTTMDNIQAFSKKNPINVR